MDDFIKFLAAGLAIMTVLLISSGFVFYEPVVPYYTATTLEFDEAYVTGGMSVGPENIVLTKFYDLGEIDIKHTKFDREFFAPSKRLFNGLLFGSNEIAFSFEAPEEMQGAVLHFTVDETNSYAPLEIAVNGATVARQAYAAGSYEISLEMQPVYTIQIKTLSSGWRMWSPSVYELSNVKATTRSRGFQSKVFNFELEKEEYSNFAEGRIMLELDEFAGSLNAVLNGEPVFNGEIIGSPKTLVFTSGLLPDDNTLELKATNNSIFKGSASLSILYKSQRQHYADVAFNVTKERYDRMSAGKIQFDVVRVERPGGLSVRIVSGANVTFSDYGNAERKSYSMPITKANVKVGWNTLRIDSVGGAVFSVKNAKVVVP